MPHTVLDVFTCILSLNPRSLVKCISSVPFYKRKLRLTGCSLSSEANGLVRVSVHWGNCRVRWLEQTDSPLQLPRMLKQESPGGPSSSPFQLVLCAGPRVRVGHSRSVSGMELVMEELVEVMVLREGAHAVGREGTGHGCSVGPGPPGVNGSDRLTCGEDEESGTTCPAHCLAQPG